jgi:hypothetical protein
MLGFEAVAEDRADGVEAFRKWPELKVYFFAFKCHITPLCA